jgi:hypothetical protein
MSIKYFFAQFHITFLIRPEQLPRPDGYLRGLYTTLPDEVSRHIHFTPVFFRGVVDNHGGIKSLLTPPTGPFQKPVEDPRTFPQQFVLEVFVLLLRRYRRGKGYQLNGSCLHNIKGQIP